MIHLFFCPHIWNSQFWRQIWTDGCFSPFKYCVFWSWTQTADFCWCECQSLSMIFSSISFAKLWLQSPNCEFTSYSSVSCHTNGLWMTFLGFLSLQSPWQPSPMLIFINFHFFFFFFFFIMSFHKCSSQLIHEISVHPMTLDIL